MMETNIQLKTPLNTSPLSSIILVKVLRIVTKLVPTQKEYPSNLMRRHKMVSNSLVKILELLKRTKDLALRLNSILGQDVVAFSDS